VKILKIFPRLLQKSWTPEKIEGEKERGLQNYLLILLTFLELRTRFATSWKTAGQNWLPEG
jgi:hypothetical protein